MNKILKTSIRNFSLHNVLKCQERFKISNGVKILIIGVALIGAGIFAVPETLAQPPDNLVVQFEPNPLFTGTNFLPGQNTTGTARVTNNSGQPQRIATEAISYPGFPNPDNVPVADLSRALSIIIREKDGSDLYGGTSPTWRKNFV